ncbi:SDR family NAD(P)-dependent oxidoreductase [Thiocapsa rosea]|uniref:NAD(P)-dependent dehydrogenase (Short-subunit alcohol dehydrogenase family) n=1 Tax=Thiocapsa rosea TaxID=69360 RepID=A0A495VD83_9GAMM|nr:SDR family oxidoreductase [Thiocapsa rosea]RKT47234.1 NAD(P)-dependent dehydrogenase (short-subunit alcohol dehydrogenase family) [Thiocapsa rosea]
MSKTYLIVGGTSGIGAALLGKLLARGHQVIQLSRHPEAAPDHPAVTSLHWDVRTNDFPADALPTTLDGLVYCPGTIRLRPFERLGEKEWMEDLEINLLGAVRALQGAMKALKAAESAGIVLFSTVAVGTGLPFHASIASAKGAVEGLTRSLAAELAPRIRVNAVAPTLTATPLAERLIGNESKRTAAADRHPLRTIGEPEDVAGAALWLLEDARMTTGQVIRVDAGLATLRTG